jgi:hypothetical protein
MRKLTQETGNIVKYLKMSNPDGASKQIGQPYWTCTSLLSTPDSKMDQFPFEFIILKMFIAETYPFSRKLPGKRKFREISRKFAHFRIFSLFAKMEKLF